MNSTLAPDAEPSLKIADNLHKTQRASSQFGPDRYFSVYNAGLPRFRRENYTMAPANDRLPPHNYHLVEAIDFPVHYAETVCH